MANGLYAYFKEQALSGLDLTSVNVKAVLVDSADYTVDLANHQDLADIAAGARVATSANLSSKTVTGGTFDSADVTFTSVTGDQSEAIVLYYDSGTEATSTLIGYWDTASSGLPVTPDGNNITVTVNASGWFSL